MVPTRVMLGGGADRRHIKVLWVVIATPAGLSEKAGQSFVDLDGEIETAYGIATLGKKTAQASVKLRT